MEIVGGADKVIFREGECLLYEQISMGILEEVALDMKDYMLVLDMGKTTRQGTIY